MQTITTNNLNEARKQIEKIRKEIEASKKLGSLGKEEQIAILSQDDEFNRKALEIKGISFLIINENLNQKDYMKQRNSGLNEVVAKICREKNITIVIDLEQIIKKSDVEKAKSLSRLKQNIMLCKKAGTKIMALDSKKSDKRAIQAIFIALGASTKQAFEASN